jgi:hypothetical protein
MRKALLILGTFALMIICGAGAALTTLSWLMNLGLKHYDNYEYYGQTPAVFLIPLAVAHHEKERGGSCDRWHGIRDSAHQQLLRASPPEGRQNRLSNDQLHPLATGRSELRL